MAVMINCTDSRTREPEAPPSTTGHHNPMTDHPQAEIQVFIDRWQSSGAAERANYALFLTELCTLIAVLAAFARPASAADVAASFQGRRTSKRLDEVGEILEMLAALGQVRDEDRVYTI